MTDSNLESKTTEVRCTRTGQILKGTQATQHAEQLQRLVAHTAPKVQTPSVGNPYEVSHDTIPGHYLEKKSTSPAKPTVEEEPYLRGTF